MLDYLGRYVQRVALSNERMLSLKDGLVRFAWRDRANGNRRKTMQLPVVQCLERFLLHVLPQGFMRIRHYGLLANRHKRTLLAHARAALHTPAPAPVQSESAVSFCQRVLNLDIRRCPACRIGTLRWIATLAPQQSGRGPPPSSPPRT